MRIAALATLLALTACDSETEPCAFSFDDACREFITDNVDMPEDMETDVAERYVRDIWRAISFPAVPLSDNRVFRLDLQVPASYDDVIGDREGINWDMLNRFSAFQNVATPPQDEADDNNTIATVGRRSGDLTIYPYYALLSEWSGVTTLVHEHIHYKGDKHTACPWDADANCDERLDQSYGSSLYVVLQLQHAFITGDPRVSDVEVEETGRKMCDRMYRYVVEFHDHVDMAATDCTEVTADWMLSIRAMRTADRESSGLR